MEQRIQITKVQQVVYKFSKMELMMALRQLAPQVAATIPDDVELLARVGEDADFMPLEDGLELAFETVVDEEDGAADVDAD